MPRDGGASAGTASISDVRVTNEGVHFKGDCGAVGDDATSNNTALATLATKLAALNGGKGRVIVEPGIYRHSTAITTPANVDWEGSGSYASVFSCPTTLGAGVWQFSGSATAGTRYHSTIRDLGFRGPAFSTGLTMGTANTNMHGLKISRRMNVVRCSTAGFNYGRGFAEDHCYIEGGESTNNHYNLVYLSVDFMWGNQAIRNFTMDGCTRASVGVEDNAIIETNTWDQVHLGVGPYGIEGIGTRSSKPTMIFNSVFTEVECEQFGNSIVKGSSTDEIYDLNWRGGGSSQDNTYKLPATTYSYLVEVGSIYRTLIDSYNWWPTTYPATAFIYASGSVFQELRLHGLPSHVLSASASGKPILKTADGRHALTSSWKNGQNAGTFKKSASALTAGQVAKFIGPDDCDLYGTAIAPKAAAGITAHACGSSEIATLITAGPYTSSACTGTVAVGDPLKPSTGTAGKLMTAAAGDHPIVGVSQSAGTDTSIQLETRVSPSGGL